MCTLVTHHLVGRIVNVGKLTAKLFVRVCLAL